MGSSCPDEAILLAYVGGEQPQAERVETEAHLARCDECRELVSALAPPGESVDATLPAAGFGAELAPGQVLDGKYAIETLIGAGGMGVVARARHRVLGTHVVVKLVSAPRVDGDTLRRFLREARAGAAIDSEHVVRVLDAGVTQQGRPYLVLEHLEGADLAQELTRRGKLGVAEAVHYVLQVCEALARAHARGIVHRDIKPANLFLTRSADDAPLIKVLDFGIAKAAEDSGLGTLAGALTETGAVMGSPRYMSPEQLEHSAGVDARTDVWALGVVLYELISGKPPFDAPNLPALAAAIVTREPEPLDALVADVPRELSNLVALCLAKRRDERIQSVTALARALARFAPSEATTLAERIERISQGRSGASSSSLSVPPVARSASRLRWAIPAGALAAILFALLLWSRRESTPALHTTLGETRSAALRVAPAAGPRETSAPALPPEPSRASARLTGTSPPSPSPSSPSAEPPPEPPPAASSAAPASSRPVSDIERDGLRDRK